MVECNPRNSRVAYAEMVAGDKDRASGGVVLCLTVTRAAGQLEVKIATVVPAARPGEPSYGASFMLSVVGATMVTLV